MGNNNTPDWAEAIATYVIAAVCLTIAIIGFIQETIDMNTLKWLLGFAVFLTGERDFKSYFSLRK